MIIDMVASSFQPRRLEGCQISNAIWVGVGHASLLALTRVCACDTFT
jgi:hypothetical protein